MTEMLVSDNVTVLDVDGIVSAHGSSVYIDITTGAAGIQSTGEVVIQPMFALKKDVVCEDESESDHAFCFTTNPMIVVWDDVDSRGEDQAL